MELVFFGNSALQLFSLSSSFFHLFFPIIAHFLSGSKAFSEIESEKDMVSWYARVRESGAEKEALLKKIQSKAPLDDYDVFVLLALKTSLDCKVLHRLKVAKFSRNHFPYFAGTSAVNPFELALGDLLGIHKVLKKFELFGTAFFFFLLYIKQKLIYLDLRSNERSRQC